MKNLFCIFTISAAFAVTPALGAISFHDLAGAYAASTVVTGPTSDAQDGSNGTFSLVDNATGVPTGVSLTVAGVSNHSNPGSWRATGDVSTLFPDGGVIDYTHAAFLSATHTFTLTGLAVGNTYDLAIFADRGYAPEHANASRSATFTLSGASSFTNTSSTGNAGVLLIDGASVQLQNGSNHFGNLARWSNIVPESDTITVTISGNGYSGNALRFETIPEPTTFMLGGLGALGLLRRRRARIA